MSHFASPWTPQPEEVRAWAYDPEATEPTQDFDLALSWARHETTYLDLASDPSCPARRYFVRVLYLIVGDAVRSGFGSVPEPVVRGFIARGSEYDHPDIRRWQARAHALLAAPGSLECDSWYAEDDASEEPAPRPDSPHLGAEAGPPDAVR